MRGRRNGDAYSLYGFLPKVNEGKYVAVCCYCHRNLANTSASRMKIHRKNCKVSREVNDNKEAQPANTNTKPSPIMDVEVVDIKTEDTAAPRFEAAETENGDADPSTHSIDEQLYNEQLENIQDYLSENPLPQDDTNSEHSDVGHEKPNVGNLIKLQEQKTAAEINYFRKKTEYFNKQLDNLSCERSLMMLQASKLRLEIQKLKNEV